MIGWVSLRVAVTASGQAMQDLSESSSGKTEESSAWRSSKEGSLEGFLAGRRDRDAA